MQKYPKVKVVKCYEALQEEGMIRVDLTREGIHLNDYGYKILTDITRKNYEKIIDFGSIRYRNDS